MSRRSRKEWEDCDELRAFEQAEKRETERMQRLIDSGRYKSLKEPLEIPFVADFPKWIR